MFPKVVQRQYEAQTPSLDGQLTNRQSSFGASQSQMSASPFSRITRNVLRLANQPALLHPQTDHCQKALKEKGIDSMLEDARNDNKDTDTEYLKRKCELYGRSL